MRIGFQYTERDLLGGWRIEVRIGRKFIGNIRKNPSTGAFQYFKGQNNILTPFLEEDTLANLKRKIEGTTI